MSTDGSTSPSPSAALRAELERRLADAEREAQVVPREGYLGVAIGERSFLLPLAQLAGLMTRRPITPLPTAMPGFVGVAGIRGEVLAVYDLGARLGQGAAVAPLWLAITAAPGRVGLAFERFTGHVRLGPVDFDADPELRLTVVDVAGLVTDIVREARRLPQE